MQGKIKLEIKLEIIIVIFFFDSMIAPLLTPMATIANIITAISESIGFIKLFIFEIIYYKM